MEPFCWWVWGHVLLYGIPRDLKTMWSLWSSPYQSDWIALMEHSKYLSMWVLKERKNWVTIDYEKNQTYLEKSSMILK